MLYNLSMEKNSETLEIELSDVTDDIDLVNDFGNTFPEDKKDLLGLEIASQEIRLSDENDTEKFSQEDLLQVKNPHQKKEDFQRFFVEQKAEIKDKIILYIEDLHVSFKNKISKKDKVKYEIENPDISWEEYKEKNKIKHVLKGINLYLKEGETLALIGANGSGKTVLMETILGYNESQQGEIYLNLGMDTYEKNKTQIGFQFQDASFPVYWTVKQWIDMNKEIFKESIDSEQIREMLNIFKIKDFYLQKISQLSGGQKQRLNLFLSIIHNPKLMILDEFITGLDIRSVKEIIRYVNELKIKNNASMIIISHQPEEVELLADRILVLNSGKIVEETTPELAKKEYGNIGTFMERKIYE